MNDTIKSIEVSFYDKENSLQLATDIYTTHVKPLEDALEKAEEREKVLVEALDVLLKAKEYKDTNGKDHKYESMREDAWKTVCAALARVKG